MVVMMCGTSQAQSESQSPTRQMVVTFDDLPFNSRAVTEIAGLRKATTQLVGTISSNRVPAIGFVNEQKLYDGDEFNGERAGLLILWLRSGLELGNHTFSHRSLHSSSLEEFEDDILRGELTTRSLMNEAGMPLRYFRHPYLHTGRDLATKRAVETFLENHGYEVAPVTVDNSEWIFARAYDNVVHTDDAMRERIARAYIGYMESKVVYYERQSRDLFGREIPQILLLHANLLNSDYFGELARMLRQRGYTFVTLEAALEDDAYRSEDTYTGPGGISWLHRWAITQHKGSEFFAGEPRTPQFVLDVAGIESE